MSDCIPFKVLHFKGVVSAPRLFCKNAHCQVVNADVLTFTIAHINNSTRTSFNVSMSVESVMRSLQMADRKKATEGCVSLFLTLKSTYIYLLVVPGLSYSLYLLQIFKMPAEVYNKISRKNLEYY